jgi:hypothetical protein
VVKMNINLHSPLGFVFIFTTYISSGEWCFIFVFTTSFQAGNGGLYSSLPFHFKRGMEIYIHLYHFISSGEWRFIFIFTTYISSGEWRFIFIFTTSFQAGNGGLYTSLPLHFKRWMEVWI